MPEEQTRIRQIAWLELFPWLGLIRAVRLAFAPRIILLGAIAYAVLQWRSRTKASDQIGERKAKQLYTDERAQRDNLPGEEAGGPPARPT